VKIADLSDINIGDILTTSWILIFFDGTQWLVIGGANRAPGQLPSLQSIVDWYVNTTTGNDSTLDGTSATVSGTHGPFKTIQRGVNECYKYNMNNYNQNIHIADGTYNESVILNVPNGAGSIFLIGNDAVPNNCRITSTAANSSAVSIIGGQWYVHGFRLSATGTGSSFGIASQSSAHSFINNLQFGPCTAYHISSSYSSAITLYGGTFIIEGAATASGHLQAYTSASISTYTQLPSPTLTVNGPVSFSTAFIAASDLGSTQANYSSIAGSGNVTGARYYAANNGVINSGGGGANYYPGSSPGTTATGGQYS
jgi:hypothetical protein